MRLSVKLGALCATSALLPLAVASVVVLPGIPPTAAPDYPVERLRSDARVAASTYEKRLEQMRLAAQHLANEIAVKIIGPASASAPEPARMARIQDLLGRVRVDLSLDFLIVTDRTGRVTARHNDQPSPGESVLAPAKNPIAERVLADGAQMRISPLAGGVVETGEQLRRLWLDQGAAVKRDDGSTLEEAFVIEAAAPIFSGGGFQGAILIGQMLNKYHVARAGANQLQTPLVTELSQTLFASGDREAGALIALGDTIVASSVRESAGSKPVLLGARRNPNVVDGEEILKSGAREYLVSWRSLKSPDESTLGAIGVCVASVNPGWTHTHLAKLAAAIAAAAALVVGFIGFLAGRALASRINSLRDAVGRMSLGELSTAIRDRNSDGSPGKDEIGHLANQLDQMRESFRHAIERLRKR
jgi:HAMP domain-containing protein